MMPCTLSINKTFKAIVSIKKTVKDRLALKEDDLPKCTLRTPIYPSRIHS